MERNGKEDGELLSVCTVLYEHDDDLKKNKSDRDRLSGGRFLRRQLPTCYDGSSSVAFFHFHFRLEAELDTLALRVLYYSNIIIIHWIMYEYKERLVPSLVEQLRDKTTSAHDYEYHVSSSNESHWHQKNTRH